MSFHMIHFEDCLTGFDSLWWLELLGLFIRSTLNTILKVLRYRDDSCSQCLHPNLSSIILLIHNLNHYFYLVCHQCPLNKPQVNHQFWNQSSPQMFRQLRIDSPSPENVVKVCTDFVSSSSVQSLTMCSPCNFTLRETTCQNIL